MTTINATMLRKAADLVEKAISEGIDVNYVEVDLVDRGPDAGKALATIQGTSSFLEVHMIDAEGEIQT